MSSLSTYQNRLEGRYLLAERFYLKAKPAFAEAAKRRQAIITNNKRIETIIS